LACGSEAAAFASSRSADLQVSTMHADLKVGATQCPVRWNGGSFAAALQGAFGTTILQFLFSIFEYRFSTFHFLFSCLEDRKGCCHVGTPVEEEDRRQQSES